MSRDDYDPDEPWVQNLHKNIERGVEFFCEAMEEDHVYSFDEEEQAEILEILKLAIPRLTPPQVYVIHKVMQGILMFSEVLHKVQEFREHLEEHEEVDEEVIRKAFDSVFDQSIPMPGSEEVEMRLSSNKIVDLGDDDLDISKFSMN